MKDFDRRDILFTEQAFATAIHMDKRSKACFNCTQLCDKSFYEKCSYCNSVFCSSECSMEGKKHHSVHFFFYSSSQLLCHFIHDVDRNIIDVQSPHSTTVNHHSTLLLTIVIYFLFVVHSSTTSPYHLSFQDFLSLCESPDNESIQFSGIPDRMYYTVV